MEQQHGLEVEFTGFETQEDASGSYVSFNITVHKDGSSWACAKRFSECRFFYTNVQEHCNDMRCEFPPKLMGRLTPDQLEERRAGLAAWMEEFLQVVPMTAALLSQLYTFLQVDQHSSLAQRGPGAGGAVSNRIDVKTRIQPGRVIKAGFLRKLGGNKQGAQGNWRRRYTVLQDDMRYFETEEVYLQGGQPKGIVKLDTYYVTILEGDNPEHEFTVHALPYPLICQADSHEEMMSWVETLRQFPEMI